MMASSSSKCEGLDDVEKLALPTMANMYGVSAIYFEKSKSLAINIDIVDQYEDSSGIRMRSCSFFEDEEIVHLCCKVQKITLHIECGSYIEVDIWNRMQSIIQLLTISKRIRIGRLNLCITHEPGYNSRTPAQRRDLFEQFMKSIIELSKIKLRYIDFGIEGLEDDVYPIYISYLIKLLLPNQVLAAKTEKLNHIVCIKLNIFGDRMLDLFFDNKELFLLHAISATSTLKSLLVVFSDNMHMVPPPDYHVHVTINEKLNTFLHYVSLNHHISSLSLYVHDRASIKKSPVDKSIVTSFYHNLYAIFNNKCGHLKSFTLEYITNHAHLEYNKQNDIALCKLDDALLMRQCVLQPIIDKAQHLSVFEWKVNMRWTEVNLVPLSTLFSAQDHHLELIAISHLHTSNKQAMTRCLQSLKQCNSCKELRLCGLDGELFTSLLCDFVAMDCAATFETLRFRMKYKTNDASLLNKHTNMILNSFVLHLEKLYSLYHEDIPTILTHHDLPPYLVQMVVDYCKMPSLKLDFSLLMRRENTLTLEPSPKLESLFSSELNSLTDKLKLSESEHEPIAIQRDCKSNHPLLKQLFAAFIYTPDVCLRFSAIDCKLLFSIHR
eukprot:42491_1